MRRIQYSIRLDAARITTGNGEDETKKRGEKYS